MKKTYLGGPSPGHKYLNIGEGDTIKIMLKLLIYYRKGVPIELPHEEDSADQWSAKRQCWKRHEPPAIWTNSSCVQMADESAG